jgi:hypothetical protein
MEALAETRSIDFERYDAFNARVEGLVDLTHASCADRREDLVGSKLHPSGQRHECGNCTLRAALAKEHQE